MKINFDIWVIVFGTLIILGIFSAFILFFRQENKLSNKILAVFLLATSLWHMDSFLNVSGIYNQNPDAYFRPIYYSFAFGPLIYFYVKSLTDHTFRFRGIHLLHFGPVILQGILYFFLFFKDYSFKRWYWLEVHSPFTYRIEFDGTFISLAIYSILSIFIIMNYQKELSENYSESSKVKLNWLKIILFFLVVLSIQWFIEVILRDFYHSFYDFNYSTLILGILTLVLAFGSFIQKNLEHINFEVQLDKSQIKKAIEIDSKILQKIEHRMDVSRDFLNPTLTLKEFSNACGLPSRTVSQHINHGLNKSFQDFVNEYRVEEVKTKLLSSDREIYTLETIAYDCGFNSKATFNRIFKKFTGSTPNTYLQ